MNVKLIKGKEPKIYITDEVMNKIDIVTDTCSKEVGMLGFVKKEDSTYTIYKIELFKQEVDYTTTEITTEGLGEFATELVNTENGIELWNDMKVWYHSHVDMSTAPSQQDEKQIDVFMENDNDFFIRIIGNKRGELRIDLYDFKVGVQYTELPYDVIYEEDKQNKIETISRQIRLLRERLDDLLAPDEKLVNDIKEEIKSKVSEIKFQPTSHYDYKWKDYDYKKYSNTPVKVVNEKSDEDIALDYFETLQVGEIYEAMMNIEQGLSSIDIFGNAGLTLKSSYILDELIEDYCNTNIEAYTTYADQMYNY